MREKDYTSKSKKIIAGIAFALGCSLMGVASAATLDMSSSEYIGGITVTDKNYPSNINDDFMYKYDAAAGTLVGGELHLTEDVWNKRMNGSFIVKAEDLPDLSSATVNKIFKLLNEKYHVDEYNSGWNNVKLKIIDADGNIIRQANMEIDSSDLTKTNYIAGGIYNQVLSNDGTADQYDINKEEYQYGTWTVPAESIFLRTGNYEITPDLSKEALKTVVKGADKDLTVTNVNNVSYLVLNALGEKSDTVYGVYNDKKGFVTLQARTVNITASGNDKSNALYAANNGAYTSKIVLTSKDGSKASALKSSGDVVNAGKNGVINLNGGDFSLESTNGNIFYAHDGGVINAYTDSGTTLGLDVKSISEGKYLALAEKGSEINIGLKTTHLDDIDYDMVNILKANANLSGDLKADADSKINLGMKANARKSDSYTGNVEGNVNLYLQDGIIWNGYALDDNASLHLINGSTWNLTTDNAQHLQNLSGGESASQRSYIIVGQGDISVDKYSGTNTFIYKHDNSDPTKMLGGNITIKSAEPYKIVSTGIGLDEKTSNMITTTDSNVFLQTSIDGIDTTDDKLVNDVLDSLAKKLTYLAYADGERNLSGRVELAEGLTTASITKYYQNLTFDEKTGQGKAEGEIHNPYSTIIMGNPATETEYGDIISGSVAEENLKYTFDGDTLIEAKITKDPRSFAMGNLYCSAINNYGNAAYKSQAAFAKNGPSFSIDMQGHDLNVIFSAFPAAGSTGSQPMWTAAAIGAFREGTISIDNPGAIYLESRNNYYYGSAIRASTAGINETGAHVVINNDNTKAHAVTIRGGIDTPAYELDWRALEAVSSFTGATKANSNTIDIKGLVDIETKYSAAIFARQGYSKVSVGGGRIYAGKHDSIWTSGENTVVNVNVIEDENGNVTGAGNNYVQITGDVRSSTEFYGEGGTINIGLTTADSFLEGHFYGPILSNEVGFSNNLWLQNGAVWNNKGVLFHPWTGPEYTTSQSSIVTNLYGGDSLANAGNIYQNESKTITIGNLSGFVNAYIGHAQDDATNFSDYGDIIIEKATQTDGKNANITLLTDRSGIDTSDSEKVNDVLKALAKKLIYKEAATEPTVDENEELTTLAEAAAEPSINLDGQVGISEGLTAGETIIRLADMDFSSEDGAGSLVEGTIHIPDPVERANKLYGSTETAMMKGAKSAMASTSMIWRAESNDLMKRMGDLRLAEGERGLWAKYYGGKYEMDAQNTKFSTSYKAYQLGYDTKVGDWTVGAAVSYNDGNSTYGNGRGDEKAISLGLYGTWNKEDGQYLDLILKRSRLENDFKVYNDSGHKLDGDYKNWATSLSAEYGKRFEGSNGFYVDPSIEFTLGRVNSKNYNAQSDYLDSLGTNKNLEVQQDAFTTAVGRLGVRVGQKLDKASYFVKLAAAHEFSGDFETKYHAIDEPEGKTSIDFGDTWYEAQIGGTAKLGDNSLLYASFERSFGGDVEEKWRVDAGLRWSF